MGLSLEEVRHVARLARLSLSPEEERRFQEQLSAVLDAFQELTALETEETGDRHLFDEPGAALREDEVAPSLAAEEALANAPATAAGHFAVPKILH